jgi:phage terminase large subunit-like protein
MRDYLAVARQYEAGVIAGRVPACKWVRLACERNARDRARAEALDPAFPYRVDPAKASAICLAAESLPHIKGPKAKIVGHDEEGRNVWASIQLEPWQCWWLTTLFGWVHRETGLRRFRVGLILVPRKNAKSTIAAVVVLYMLTADKESGAECYSAATTRDQAKVVAEITWHMASRSPLFCEYYGVKIGAKTMYTLEVPDTASKFSPLSADEHTLDALNVSLAVVDELHAHRTRGVWDVLDTATGAREQPLLLATTTAGVSIGGICYEKVQHLHKILERVYDDEQFFGIEYTADEGDDWRAPATWVKANPNFGVSVQPDDLARKAREAEHSPAAVNNFLTKHLNMWVGSESAWLDMDEWRACADPTLSLEQLAADKVPCWLGVDLAETRDIAAVVALFRLDEQRWAAIGRYFLPEAAVEASPIAQYSGWVRDGWLTATDGTVADFQRIEDAIVEWCERLNVQEVDFDRALAAHMEQRLQARLGDRPPVVVVQQNVVAMHPAMQAFDGLVSRRAFRHVGDPVLTWMASNVVAAPNYKDELYPRKSGGKDSHNKIDGIIALLTALSRATAAPEPPPTYQMLIYGGQKR